ncbi:hypothetical protein [Sphingobacterium gobiense]|uniref:Uncharacterized protein n=1 Tax=Sphingobacterium gobiense TaxID=1382456 RepID=A0A2S9JEN3_9SPHI|nr:hypothetical protein [Sphingobacterium gobiense]PRD51385.1 hypothetical protein C5749_18425 [Sphingobacterium gobiense]
MNDKDLDKLFQEHLEHHTAPPRNDIWHQIENRLDQQKVVPVRRLNWVSYAAIAVGCLGLIALLYNIMPFTTTEDISIITQKEVPMAAKNTKRESSNSVQSVIPVKKGHAKRSEQEVAKKDEFVQKASISEKKKPANERLPLTEEPRVELVGLEPAGVSLPLTADLDIDDKVPQKYAISVPPVAPLIDSPETEESMLASTRKKPTEGIVPGILNKISDALNPTDNTSVQFSKDDEGFLRLDIVNSLVKNRNKKRR